MEAPQQASTIGLVAALPKVDANYTTIDGTNGGGSPAGVIVDGSGFLCFNIEDSRGNEIKGLQITGCSDGVRLTGGAELTTIGGTGAGEGNVISGNSANGVVISAESAANHILGNYIGTTADGSAADGNVSSGVRIETGAHHNHVGDAATGARNIISANGQHGVLIAGSATTNNVVAGNYVGTDVSGSADLGNGSRGVQIISGSDNIIGGTTAGAGNVISANFIGVAIDNSDASSNLVQGNYIGTDSTGTVDLGNVRWGVLIVNGPSNVIGGTTAEARNIISGNDEQGVLINAAPATGNLVQGNYIGTDVAGTVDLGNSLDGVKILAPGNTIGGAEAGARNLISGNDSHGVWISGAGGTGNTVLGNYIGTDVTGTVDLGNSLDGVQISGAPANAIGGTTDEARNVISGNTQNGVLIAGSGATGNDLLNNYLGTDKSGLVDIGNRSFPVAPLGSPYRQRA